MSTIQPGDSARSSEAPPRIKVVLAKVSMDGHDRGVKVLARLLRDAEMEVVYLGKFLPHEAVIEAAVQEHAQVVGLSFLSGEHLAHTRRFAALLRGRGLEDVLLLVGGVIPRGDIPALLEAGADGVFVAGTSLDAVVAFIRGRARGPAGG
ncbi:MAG: cobalamin B12-binding domain-containing protein [Candidatus Rokubacteria bacterium]|nr:cobalamin B12-binding domain-containing protein [Candidatus Rokubacteria bacterium]